MKTEMQMQMEIDEGNEKMFKKRASRMYIYMAVVVVVVILCCLGIGIGVGYAIWNESAAPLPTRREPIVQTSIKPGTTPEPIVQTTSQQTVPPVSTPKPGTTPEPIVQTTSEPAQHWIDTPCISGSEPVCPPGVDRPPLILVSLDGFRADYLNRELTAHIKRLSECGTHAPYMLPSFPTVTFPNHYTIVTGLYPEHNGLIGNEMYDPVQRARYKIGNYESGKKEWYWGEPIWNTAMKQDLRVGCYFWVASDVNIQDMRPNYFFKYTDGNTPEQKIDIIRGWLQLPTGKRPDFITLYFNEPDHEGHATGPNSVELNEKLEEVDKYIADLMDVLLITKMHQCANIIILADHGMANRSCDNSVILGDKDGINFPTGDYYDINTAGCMMRYNPMSSATLQDAEDIVNRLKCRDPNVVPYAKEDMPKRWHYMNNRRIEKVLIPVEQGYTITNSRKSSSCGKGGHGYDNLAIQMQALFLAYGPAFKKNLKIEPFQNIELFNIMCDILDIEPPPNDGEYGSLHQILQNPPALPPVDRTNYSVSLGCPYPGSDQEYSDRLAADESMCECNDVLANVTDRPLKDFDEQLRLSASAMTASKSRHALFGVPEVTFKTAFCELVQTDYVTAYSHELKMPLYTSFTIDKKDSRDSTPSFECARPDVRVAGDVTPNCTDYNMSNLTMGFSYSPGLAETLEAKMDTLITSNMVPQYPGFIEDIWSGYLDDYLPKWADKYNGINVVTGPIFDYDLDGLRDSMAVLAQEGKKFQDTFIPTHYFAVITRCSPSDTNTPLDTDCSPLIPLAFILHNKDGIQTCQTPTDYMETNIARVKDVELLTGLKFYPNLDAYEAIRLRIFNVEREHFFKYWDKN